MIARIIEKLRVHGWTAYLLASLGGALYTFQAWSYARIQTSFLDEGGYLYLGLQYAKGFLRPYQDYGAVRLYAPLAYLIPGNVEDLFGPGLQTGRYFSIFCSLVMILALWWTARRLGGKWSAAAVVWAIALTPISVQIYSLAISEALVACLLVLSLMFVLGEKRPLWQVLTGSVLAGLLVMTRQNMLPLLPLLVVYVFWQHGKRAGLLSVAACLLPILIIHLIYWPNILELWSLWLPPRLTPFLDPYRFPQADLATTSNMGFSGRLLAFLQGIRFHYFTMVGFSLCLFFWPARRAWKSRDNRGMAFFLAALFLALTLLHAYATFIMTDPAVLCTFCFTPYLAFFDVIVFLLMIVSIPSWNLKVSPAKVVVIVLFILLLSAGLGFAAFDRLGPPLLEFKFPAITRGLDPRQWTPFITLGDILANKYSLDYWASRAPVSTVAGLVIGTLGLLFGILLFSRLRKSGRIKNYSLGAFILVGVFIAGVILSPLMGGTYRDKGICKADIPKTYAQIGRTIRESIPPGSQVYWGANSAVPLLYTTGLQIHPPQVYSISYFRLGGDPDQLLKHGFWNPDLAGVWLAQADAIVTESAWASRVDFPDGFDLSQYEELHTAAANPCDPVSILIIYRKKP